MYAPHVQYSTSTVWPCTGHNNMQKPQSLRHYHIWSWTWPFYTYTCMPTQLQWGWIKINLPGQNYCSYALIREQAWHCMVLAHTHSHIEYTRCRNKAMTKYGSRLQTTVACYICTYINTHVYIFESTIILYKQYYCIISQAVIKGCPPTNKATISKCCGVVQIDIKGYVVAKGENWIFLYGM